MARNITLAVAGSGEVKEDTIRALLDDFLGFGPVDDDGYPAPSENDIRLIFPASVEHYGDSLQKVLNWSEYADLPYEAVLAKGDRDESLERLVEDAEHVHEVVNVDAKIVDLLAEAEGEKFLVLLWRDEDEHAEILLDLADTKGIKALDLTAGLDDLSFADEGDEAAPEPEPEPEPEKPARGRRGGRRAQKDEEPEPEPEKPTRGGRRAKEEPLEEAEEALTDEPEEAAKADEPEPQQEQPKRRGRARKPEPEHAEPAPEQAEEPEAKTAVPTQDGGVLSVDAAYLSGALQSIFLHLQAVDAANAYKNLADPVESPVTALAREALEHVSLGVPAAAEEEPVEETKRGRGRPRKTPVEEETTGYLVNGDGVYRKAGRGRPKRGEEKVDLTAAQVAELAGKGLILDEE